MAIAESFFKDEPIKEKINSGFFLFDDNIRVVEIAGVKYDYSLFEELGIHGMAEGQIFRLLKREDGQVTIQRL